jgi:hypothetical protein
MRAEIGHSRPPFALQDQDDRNATPLDDEVIGDPAVIMFDRNPPGGAPDISAGLRRAVGRLQSRLEDRPGGMIVPIFVISLYSVAENAGLADAEGITFRLLSDPHGEVFALYGVDPAVSPVDPGSNADVDPASLVLDPNGRVVQINEDLDTAAQMERIEACLRDLDAARPRGALGLHPPVLVLPNAMDPEICTRLIERWHDPVPLYEGDGKQSAGLDIEKGDVKVLNRAYGNVTQYVLRDPELSRELDDKVLRRVVPEIEKAFGYSPSKREDYRIACYDVAEGGALPAHRDNPTESTRHRRFTVSINLNNASFEGGELVFREWSDHLYDIDEGMAVAWSCSLLHEVMPITKGRRFILGTHLFG